MIGWTLALAGARPPAVDLPLATGAVAASDVALVVANEDYYAVADVPYAARDGAAVGAWLVRTRGVPPERVRVLRDVAAEQIAGAVAELAPLVGDGGTFWLYFAGHGAADPATGERLLLGNDVRPDPAVFRERAVRVEDLARVAAARADVVLWIDACFNGAGRSGGPIGDARRYAVPVYAAAVPRVVEWAATGPDQLAGQWAAAEHGTFTYLALGALRGWADGELDGAADGAVTLAEAQAYVSRSLAAAGSPQSPQLRGSGELRATIGGTLERPPPPEALASATAPAPRRGVGGPRVAGGLLLGGAAALAAGAAARADLRADVGAGRLGPAAAGGRITAVNALFAGGYAGVALGAGTGFVVLLADGPAVGGRVRW